MEGLMPTFDVNGGNCNNDGWGNWGGALIGGAIGGAVGGAWNGNRWNNGGNCCCNNNAGQYVMDTLTTMRTDINSIGRDNLMQTAGVQSAMCQGFGGVNATVERTAMGQQLTAAQGFAGLNTAILTGSMQGQLAAKDAQLTALSTNKDAEIRGMQNTFEIVSSQKDCCCTTNANIERQGCATREVLLAEGCATRAAIDRQGQETRALISALDRERLLRESAAKDAKIAQLECQTFNTGLAASTQAQCRQDMNQMMSNIIGHVAILAGNRTGSSATGGAAQAA